MDKLISLYIDCPSWEPPIKADDFLIAVGKLKSNSVYHVFKVNAKPNPIKRIIRYYVKVFKSDLMNCLKRDECQNIIIIKWYSRNKKKLK